MTNTKFNARLFSRLGQSGSIFGLSVIEQRKQYPIKVLSADMSVTAGLDRYKSTFPDDFYNVGIAEQNLIGIASGLATEGYKSITVAQAAFISMRSFEQVRQFMGYMHNNVISIGISSGFALTYFGNTHYAIEDLNLMRGIPNMVVLSPADAGAAVKAFESALSIDHPVYIRLTGGLNNPIVYSDSFDFQIGRSITLQHGHELVIIATGSMVFQAMEAAKIIEKDFGITPTIIDMHTIKPIDREMLTQLSGYKLIITIEEHNIVGGLGTAVCEFASEIGFYPPVLRLGVQDTFSPVGEYQYLLRCNRLTPDLIAEDIINKYHTMI